MITAVDTYGNESDYSNEISGSSVTGISRVSSTSSGGGGGCFIATAVYGSDTVAEVILLKNFRDNILLTNPIGKSFVKLYYSNSPPIAAFIARHDYLRSMIRIGLLPVIALSRAALKIGLTTSLVFMCMLGFGLVYLVVKVKP